MPDFDPDIDEGLPTQEHQETHGSASIIQQSIEKSDKCKAPALSQRDVEEVDWPDMMPVKILPQPDQDSEQTYQYCQQDVRQTSLTYPNWRAT